MKDYYKILDVTKDASFDQIKKAYRNLAIKWHPDKNKDPEALDKFKEISEAFQILSDKQKKYEYDILLQNNELDNNYMNLKDPFEIFNEVFSIINNVCDAFMSFDNFFKQQNSCISIHIIDLENEKPFLKNNRPPRKTKNQNPLLLKQNNNKWVISYDDGVKIGKLSNGELNNIINRTMNGN